MKHHIVRLFAVSALTLGAMSAQANSTVQVLHVSEGTVQAVDRVANKVTLKHGPIKSKTVEMPGMTMAFPVQNPALLADMNKGDKVTFVVEKVNGTITVTELKVER